MAAGLGSWSVGLHKPECAALLAGASTLTLLVFLTCARPYRTSWLTAYTATFVVLFAGLNGLLPEYARRFSLRHSVHMQMTAERPVTPCSATRTAGIRSVITPTAPT